MPAHGSSRRHRVHDQQPAPRHSGKITVRTSRLREKPRRVQSTSADQSWLAAPLPHGAPNHLRVLVRGADPAPQRTSSTWAAFLRSRAQAVIAADFFEATTSTAPAGQPAVAAGRRQNDERVSLTAANQDAARELAARAWKPCES